jgi:uncharacterized protein
MAITAFREMSPFRQLMFSAFIIIACFLAAMVISLVIAIPFFGLNSILNLSNINNLADPQGIKLLKYFQVAQSIGIFIFPPFLLSWLFSDSIFGYLQLKRKPAGGVVLLVILLTLTISPGINLLGSLNSKMTFPEWLSGVEHWMRNAEDNATRLTEAFLKADKLSGLIFNLFMIAFLPAIGEELLFRGVIQKLFTSWTKNVHLGIWFSAFLFSALHFQFYGFVPRLILGVLFGYLLVWSGSLWLPIIAHFINNAAAVIAWFLVDKKLLSAEIDDLGAKPGSFYMAFISFGFAALIIWLIWKNRIAENTPPGKTELFEIEN